MKLRTLHNFISVLLFYGKRTIASSSGPIAEVLVQLTVGKDGASKLSPRNAGEPRRKATSLPIPCECGARPQSLSRTLLHAIFQPAAPNPLFKESLNDPTTQSPIAWIESLNVAELTDAPPNFAFSFTRITQ
jgi:hypothetical protein